MRCLVIVVLMSVAVGMIAGKEEEVHGGHHDQHDPLGGDREIDGERNKHRDHEAVIGSRKEADEADEMDPEEARELLQKLAVKHDKDNDNRISREEFMDWILESFRSLDREEAEDRLKEEDEDHNGVLTWKEYLKSQYDYDLVDVDRMRGKKDEDDNENMIEMVDDDEVRFKAADLNNDGQLDKEEYVAFYHPYDFEYMHQYEIKRGVKDVDKDNDGKVTMAEYIGDIEDEESRLSEEEQFKEYDTDSDGILQGDELKKWLIQDNKESAREEVDHLMELADGDHDDFLTFEEILEHQEDFVSSQATDYGTTLEKMRDEL